MEAVTPKDEEFIYENGVSIFQLDLEREITFINRDFIKINNYSKDEIISQKYNLLIHPNIPKAILSKMWETLRSGENWNGIIQYIRKDGSFYWSHTDIKSLIDTNNNVTGYISVVKPTSIKMIQETTQIYKKMLQTQA